MYIYRKIKSMPSLSLDTALRGICYGEYNKIYIYILIKRENPIFEQMYVKHPGLQKNKIRTSTLFWSTQSEKCPKVQKLLGAVLRWGRSEKCSVNRP